MWILLGRANKLRGSWAPHPHWCVTGVMFGQLIPVFTKSWNETIQSMNKGCNNSEHICVERKCGCMTAAWALKCTDVFVNVIHSLPLWQLQPPIHVTWQKEPAAAPPAAGLRAQRLQSQKRPNGGTQGPVWSRWMAWLPHQASQVVYVCVCVCVCVCARTVQLVFSKAS